MEAVPPPPGPGLRPVPGQRRVRRAEHEDRRPADGARPVVGVVGTIVRGDGVLRRPGRGAGVPLHPAGAGPGGAGHRIGHRDLVHHVRHHALRLPIGAVPAVRVLGGPFPRRLVLSDQEPGLCDADPRGAELLPVLLPPVRLSKNILIRAS